jgi:DNA-binding transcriptional MerR regulator
VEGAGGVGSAAGVGQPEARSGRARRIARAALARAAGGLDPGQGAEAAPPTPAAPAADGGPGVPPVPAGSGGEAGGPSAPQPSRIPAAGEALAEVAAAVLGPEPVAAVPVGGEAAPGPDLPLSFAQACARLGTSPHVLRRLMDEYEEVLPPLVDAGPERHLPPGAVELLGRILRWRQEGRTRQEIVTLARGLGAAQEQAAGPAGAGPEEVAQRLVAELARLHDELRRTEERRAEDRDRLLTALMRTHQELQHLRYELAAARSRKERRRRGLWGRLFG